MLNLNDQALNAEYKTCKFCKEEKKRFKDGKFPNGKDYRIVDEAGKQWSGLVCPQCHSTRNAKRQKTKRARKKLYV